MKEYIYHSFVLDFYAGIVSHVLPIASASGPAIIGVVVVGSGLFLRWLLHQETNDERREGVPESNGKAPHQE
jgi:hypothetical protein